MKRILPHLICGLLAVDVYAGQVAANLQKVAEEHTASTVTTPASTTYKAYSTRQVPGWNAGLPLLCYTVANDGHKELSVIVSRSTSTGYHSYLLIDQGADERLHSAYRGSGATLEESRHNLAKNAEEIPLDEELTDTFSYAMAIARHVNKP